MAIINLIAIVQFFEAINTSIFKYFIAVGLTISRLFRLV